jgi:hypothetical protein
VSLSQRWKIYWLELYTSKSWGYGKYPGRYLGTLLAQTFVWGAVIFVRIVIKGESWREGYFLFFYSYPLMAAIFVLTTISSVFSEKKQYELWRLIKDTAFCLCCKK